METYLLGALVINSYGIRYFFIQSLKSIWHIEQKEKHHWSIKNAKLSEKNPSVVEVVCGVEKETTKIKFYYRTEPDSSESSFHKYSYKRSNKNQIYDVVAIRKQHLSNVNTEHKLPS